MLKTYYIKTFGCAMNTSDSQRIASFLEKQGFVLARKIEDADLAVFNTCGIRQTAENRAYGIINNLKKQATKSKKQIKIVMTGCLANRKDVQRRMKASVDLFTEIKDFQKNVSCIKSESKIRDTRYEIRDTENVLTQENISYLSIEPKHANSFSAFVPIMTGCNNFCAYCVVPYARGREVSRSADEILKEVKRLVKEGFREIILLGQNVNSYCDKKQETRDKDYNKDYVACRMSHVTFPGLLRKINNLPGNFWISFISSHPKDFDDTLIRTIAKCRKVCEWVHLPIQAGNDKILEKMNRRYTQKDYLNIIEKIKEAFEKYKPHSLYSISSDIIVGFPGETKKQFLDSAKIMEKAEFDMVYFGQFSPRPGTKAFQMKDDVSQKEKTRREKFLNEILKKTAFKNNQKYVGKILDVLIEKMLFPEAKLRGIPRSLASGKNVYFGHTRTMKNVKISSGNKIAVGKIIKVKITKANIWNLEGETK